MKIFIYIFAAACLINGLTAADLSAFRSNTNSENFGSNFLGDVVPADDNAKESPPKTIFQPQPSAFSTTRKTTTVRTSTKMPTTPLPTVPTTHRPLPPPPRPLPTPRKNPQIYNNRVNAMHPFAGRLINVVLNRGGKQKTIQRNQLLYNIKRTGSNYLEEKSNE